MSAERVWGRAVVFRSPRTIRPPGSTRLYSSYIVAGNLESLTFRFMDFNSSSKIGIISHVVFQSYIRKSEFLLPSKLSKLFRPGIQNNRKEKKKSLI